MLEAVINHAAITADKLANGFLTPDMVPSYMLDRAYEYRMGCLERSHDQHKKSKKDAGIQDLGDQASLIRRMKQRALNGKQPHA